MNYINEGVILGKILVLWLMGLMWEYYYIIGFGLVEQHFVELDV